MSEKLKVSPKQFDVLNRVLMEAEIKGHGPYACTEMAFRAAGLKVPKQSVEIVVDYELGNA